MAVIKITERDVDIIEKMYADGATYRQIMNRYQISDTVALKLRSGEHQIQLRRKARARAAQESKPCPRCKRPLVPPCRICAMLDAAEKFKRLAAEGEARAKADRAKRP